MGEKIEQNLRSYVVLGVAYICLIYSLITSNLLSNSMRGMLHLSSFAAKETETQVRFPKVTKLG